MPPKKKCWGDIPNESEIEDRDVHGKWILCKICNIKIRIRAQYSLTEWKTHLDSVRHNELSKSKVLRSCQKLTDFFPKKRLMEKTEIQSPAPPKKRNKIISCPGFHYSNNSDYLSLYAKYQKEDK